MAITEEQFKGAKEGDAFVDIYGRLWTVKQLLKKKPYLTLLVDIEGDPVELKWYDEGEGIVDDDFGLQVELNHPDAQFLEANAVSSGGPMKEVQMSFRPGHRFDMDKMMLNLCRNGGYFIDNKGGGDCVVTQEGKMTLEEFFTPTNIKRLEAGGVTITIIN